MTCNRQEVPSPLIKIFDGRWMPVDKSMGYWVSENGHAARIYGNNARILIGTKCGFGYRALSIQDGSGKYRRIYIHRAVCTAFHGEPPEGAHARHLDCDLTNNSVRNLAWGSPLDNAADAKRNGKVKNGEKNHMAKLTWELVSEMRRQRMEGMTYKSIGASAGVSTMTALRAVKGESWNKNKSFLPL